MFQAIVGFVMVIALVYCLITKKLLPPIAFVLFPVIAALICGFSITDIGTYAGKGISGMVSTVSLFVFSISFFSLMSDAGIFDIIVNRLTKAAGKNITAIMIATALIAVVGHLDGSGATTYIITTTAMLPIFKRMNLDKRALMLITSLAIGVMNLVPWGGPTMRAATVLEMTPSDLWTPLIPVQGLMLFFLLVVAFLQGRIATRNQAKISENAAASEAELTSAPETAKSPAWKLAVNYILTLAVLVVLVLDLLPAAFVFMLGLSIGLIVNIPDLKKQNQKLKEYGTAAMSMVVTLFSAGVFYWRSEKHRHSGQHGDRHRWSDSHGTWPLYPLHRRIPRRSAHYVPWHGCILLRPTACRNWRLRKLRCFGRSRCSYAPDCRECRRDHQPAHSGGVPWSWCSGP